ncbi:fibrinogen alpha chain [Pseudophryne corroboree]|uniref:fibrinogen alpha chain n=1 Tax=Pseudophryne corroboree TaxID=495146 RepID=UPI0030812398
MLRAIPAALLLCLVGTTWGESFIEEGATGRGPRLEPSQTNTECKQEKNWPICSDDDWGPKCPSGCRIQGLTNQADKDFAKRIDIIKQQLKDGESNYKSIDITTKETYDFIKDKLVSAQQTDSTYNMVTESLKRKIDFLKITVSSQVERIKLLQRNVREQVAEMKRLEVDIDIKLRACKGSCAKSIDYNVDHDSYENIKKLVVQLESTDLRPNSDPLPLLKMRPVKESTVPPHYKALTLQKEQFPLFHDIEQYSFVLEGKSKEVKGQPLSSTSVTFGSTKEQPSETKFVVIGGKGTQSGGDKTVVTSESRVVSCTKTIQKKIIQGPAGPKEEITETLSGGEECQRLEQLKADGKGKLDSDGTYTVRVTGSGSLGDANLKYWEDFLSGKTVNSGLITGGDDEFDDFSHTDLGAPSFIPIKSQSSSGSSTFTKTVYSSSGDTKEGSQTVSKYKSGPVLEDVGPIQHQNSEEDTPDFSARSVRPGTKETGLDCAGAKSGIFKIRPEGSHRGLSVYCDQDTQLGGWILIQQREDGSVNFNRTWEDYKNGFGSVDGNGKGELWLGNEYIHLLSRKETILRIELEDWSGKQVYAEYNFRLGSESEGYALNVNSYDGSAGDALIEGSKDDREYTSHVNMKFSTYDRDSDKWEENCAEMYGGGWWYNNCQAANLNGIYYPGGQYDPRNNAPYEIENGIIWVLFKPVDYSLKTVKMKIRPVDTE